MFLTTFRQRFTYFFGEILSFKLHFAKDIAIQKLHFFQFALLYALFLNIWYVNPKKL